ncbi:hypothetical protein B0E46_07710 [Rhodanobacter sp. B04]|uniref:hypothetical protein n=1 Tax=Rhodanobacter sp. B04 TaxID=1945860 RepID=UPI000985C29B|nr:hypothetical protein [Rhodanobacter sp. B04]OOG64514.1 hypothetical protein B0E46_07710 [Rhodanobacter sp. B04]
MKHHLSSLLQRKRTDFEGARDGGRPPRFDDAEEKTGIQPKDGYDWLALIKTAAATRPAARG